MYKKNAIMVAAILAIVAVAFVVVVTSVYVDTSEERYGQLNEPQTEFAMDKDASSAAAPVEEESTRPEPEEDSLEAVSEQADTVPEASSLETLAEPVVENTPAEQEPAPTTVAQDEPVSTPEEAVAENEGGEIHIVTAQGLKYEPLVVKIQPGDSIAWENMPTHDTQSLEGLIPEGAEPWHSPLGENFQRTFTVEGIYVYKCTPHFGAGMGGVIIVGNPVNLDVIKAAEVKGAARRLVKKAIAAAESM